ncbi:MULTISPECIES: YncE family protein [unclassified Mesobacillus]|uniref:YncE family protein n=1 Tax=unclassified Mesobacillus TaxID=2675270 RepID=UPI00203BE00B|nr:MULTISPECIES: YncE family protein [unclassified Mesobacillus]MCM3125062.1 YncE family protein [Mesobacillus sp. MER 33]MCM3235178.1 YncE family protein [Mesobacillus sp. MER 48]
MKTRILNVGLIFFLILSSLSPIFPSTIATAEATGQLKIEGSLADWIFDQQTNQIYAVTAEGNLQILSAATLQLEKSVSLQGRPSDIKKVNNELYIALPDTKKIVVFDLTTTEITEEYITTLGAPYRIEITGDKLFYVEEDQDSRLYEYNLTTFLDKEITIQGDTYSSFHEPDLILNNEKDTLYIAESGISGSTIEAISTTDYSLKSEMTYDDSYGFSYPERNLILDGNDIFFAGRKLDSLNLGNIHGSYLEDPESETAAKILGTDENFVYTKSGVFKRDTYQKVHSFSFKVEELLVGNGELYLYNVTDGTIQKSTASFTAPAAQFNEPVNNKLSLPPLQDWVMDEANKKIYAISKHDNLLLYINSETLEVEHARFIGSMPTDIDRVGNQLYIANYGGTNISVTGLNHGDSISTVTTTQSPYNIATDGTDLYYVPEDQHVKIYHVDLTTQTESQVGSDTYFEADIEFDSVNNRLYLGESGSSGSNLYILNPQDGSVVAEDGLGFSYPSRKVIVDNNDIFYAEHQLGNPGIAERKWNYQFEILNVNDSYVFTEEGIYNRADHRKVYGYPEAAEVQFIEMDQAGQIFIYLSNKQALYRFESLTALKEQLVKNLQVGFNPEDAFQLSWDTATGDGYYLYSKKSTETSFDKLDDSLIINNSYVLTDMQLKSMYGETVTFGVKSLFGGAHSPQMNTVPFTFEIPVPENFTADMTEGTLNFNWDSVRLMDGYNLYYYTESDPTVKKLNESLVSTNSYKLTSELFNQWSGETVYFAVASSVNGKESDKSNVFEYKFPILPPANFTGEFFELGFLRLEWDAVSNIDGYSIYYHMDSNPAPQKLNEELIKGTSVLIPIENFKSWAGKKIYFTATATKNNVESKKSNVYSYVFSGEEPPVKEDPIEVPKDQNGEESGTTEEIDTDPSDSQEDKEDSEGNTVIEHTRTIIIPSLIIKGDNVTVSDNMVKRLPNGGILKINLKDDTTSIKNVVFSAEQLEIIKKTNATVSIEKGSTTVNIPAEIFEGISEEVSVKIHKLNTLPNGESIPEALSEIYDFTINYGTDVLSHFSKPVTLSFKIDPEKVKDPNQVKVYYWNPEKEEWEEIGGTYYNGVIYADTNHFSIYTVFETSATQSEPDEGIALPNTATNVYNNILYGMILIVLGSAGAFIYRKRRTI